MRHKRIGTKIIGALVVMLLGISLSAQAQRSLGIDVSAYQGSISAANWATLKRATNVQVGGINGDGRDFVIIRSSRGGTTGEDHRQGGYPSGNNTFFSMSDRYDDPYYVQNINRAVAAGLFAGSYHFARPDVVATSTNSDGSTVGVANTGTDEADHFLQMAEPFMRPGFLPPILDLEAGDGIRTDNQMAQFCVDFSERIYQVMGIRPGIYINGNYAANILQTTTTPSPMLVVADFPYLWNARWPNQTNVGSILVQTDHPTNGFPAIYGPWDDSPNPMHPWKFWQYASKGRVNAIGGGTSDCDVDVAHGGIEFLKDQLIPAIWITNSDGLWTTLTNWNSGLTPITPPASSGQLTPIGTQTFPTPRLPSTNDTVILDGTNFNVILTLDSGSHNIRKLYMRETLNITGGSLAINYVPSSDSTPIAAQFSGPVTLSGAASLSVHTLQVDSTRTFTLNGGTLTFDTLSLMPHSTTPAKIMIGGNMSFNSLIPGIFTITNGVGAGASGLIDLGGGTRSFSIGAGSDLIVSVPISNGGLAKSGTGTMRLTQGNSFANGTSLSTGKLLVNNTSGSGTGSGAVTVTGGTLGGSGTIAGTVTINGGGTIAPGPGPTIGKLTLNSVPVFNGTNFMKVDRNGGLSLADKIVLTTGTLNYGGTLVISNAGTALIGGEVFTNFVAPAFSGAFGATQLPVLASGLNWYLGDLNSKGSIKVNRSPIPPTLTFTNTPGSTLEIPIASLTAGATDADGDATALTSINLTTSNGYPLQANSTSIFFSNNVNAADSFLYTISDGHGGSATGFVNIASSTVGQFTAQPTVNSNSVTVHFAGGPGSTYYLERSTNLPTFVTISTNVLNSNGVLDYSDDFHDLSEPPSAAFYRLRWVP